MTPSIFVLKLSFEISNVLHRQSRLSKIFRNDSLLRGGGVRGGGEIKDQYEVEGGVSE